MAEISIWTRVSCEDLPELIRFYRSNFYVNQYRMDEPSRRAYFENFMDSAIDIISDKYGYENLYEKQIGQNHIFTLMNKYKKQFDIGTACLSSKDEYDCDFGKFLAFARMIDVINDGYTYSSCVAFLREVMPEFFD